MKLWKPKTWVVDDAGRLGCVARTERKRSQFGDYFNYRTLVQFGADGPFLWRKPWALRRALQGEIDEKMGAPLKRGPKPKGAR